MPQPDEPLFDSEAPERRDDSPSIHDRVRRLVEGEPYGVLCTRGAEQPYGALIALAFTEDLEHAVFATPVTTRKYRHLSACDHVALVIDNRSATTAELMEIEAVTATGRSRLIDRDGDFDLWADAQDVSAVLRALRDDTASPVVLPARAQPAPPTEARSRVGVETPRQLIGQPASPGLATGSVRSIRGGQDLGSFRHGEVLVCDAIQPAITHLVPLASAIVERRGGMLIHGAIIARELGIPCVNGVRNAADLLKDGQVVTVDGHLGIVSVGEPEFDLEFQA